MRDKRMGAREKEAIHSLVTRRCLPRRHWTTESASWAVGERSEAPLVANQREGLEHQCKPKLC